MRIQKEIENVERVKDKIATMPLTMEDAIEFHKQVVDRVEKERKEINKELDLDDDIEEKGFTGASKEPKKVSTPELKKMKLAESLFENTLNESFKPSKGFISYLLQELDNSLDEDRLYEFFETLLDDFDMSAADIYNYMYFLNKTGDLEFISEIILDINNIEHDIAPTSEISESTGPMLIIFDDDENYKQITNQAIKVLKKYKINAKLVQYNDEEAYGVIVLNGILNSTVSESLNESSKMDDSFIRKVFEVYYFNSDFDGFISSCLEDLGMTVPEIFNYTPLSFENDFNRVVEQALERIAGDDWEHYDNNTFPGVVAILDDYYDVQQQLQNMGIDAEVEEGLMDDEDGPIYITIKGLLNNKVSESLPENDGGNESLNECDKFKKGDCKNYALDETLKEEINLNDYDDGYVELRDGKPRFVYSTLRDAKDGMFWSQMGDNEYDLGNHSYEIKKWENGKLKDLVGEESLKEAKISRQNQRRKRDAYLQRKEAEREKAEEEAKERERIGDAAWSEKDWIAEREKGDLDFSNYSDEEKAEIEKRLKAFDDNKTAQAQYQRRKEAEERKKAEEERKKAEQEKEEKTKKNLERIGKAANAPKDVANAFKKGLGNAGIHIG